MIKKYMSLLLVVVLVSCGVDVKRAELSGNEKESELLFFDDELLAIDSLNFDQEIVSLEKNYPAFFINDASADFWKTQLSSPEMQKIHGYMP